MADAARHDPESMYCHACHHQWQRQGDSIECPACMSSSTEIITPENDPRHFHNRPQATAAGSNAAAAQEGGSQPTPVPYRQDEAAPSTTSPESRNTESQNSNSANPPTGGSNTPPAGHGPRLTFRFTTADIVPITFVTFVGGSAPPGPTGENQPPLPPTPPLTLFGMQFFPHFAFPAPPPPTVNNSPPAETDRTTPEQTRPQQPENGQQPQSQPTTPHQGSGTTHTTLPTALLTTLLASLFTVNVPLNPANAVFGDAVYSQEALDRIITQLRDQLQPGGAPPASQAALDRLQVRELDEKMLACEGGDKVKCVVCVDEMGVGEKAAFLPCGHFFHGECVIPWLKMHGTCPVCRGSVEVEAEGKASASKGVDGNVGSGGEVGAAPQPQPEVRGEGADAMDCS
ncbi:hypothetical protein VTI74DRAFT_1141 [Chaetomium olivicolor]